MTFTVLGGPGFIGSHLVHHLRLVGEDCCVPPRDFDPEEARGAVIYCIGLTSDFRSRPFDTVEAHVTRLSDLLKRGRFDSMLYLSSTRVYAHSSSARETEPVVTDPSDPSDLYNLSKALGEALCLGDPRPSVRVVRLSNVYGRGSLESDFLSSVLADVRAGAVEFATAGDSEKDFVAVEDVVDLLPKIARSGRHRLYNLASGRNVSNQELASRLAELTGCRVSTTPGARSVRFPPIDTSRIRDEFRFHPRGLLEELPRLLQEMT